MCRTPPTLGGVPYATNFVANWGNEDGQRLMPGALDYTVYRVVDDKRASRLFGRESWDLMLAAAVELPVEGLEPLGIRGDYGYPSPLSPPVGSSERKKEGKKLRSLEQKAKEALGSLELEGALFWGGLRFHAFKTAVLTAVVAAAGCYYGGLLALNVMAGGYATLELERTNAQRCYAWHYRVSAPERAVAHALRWQPL